MKRAQYEGYRANLLQNAKYQMNRAGGRITVRGCHVYFYAANGERCVVWFPPEGRVRDLDLSDMKDAILYMSGSPAFSAS